MKMFEHVAGMHPLVSKKLYGLLLSVWTMLKRMHTRIAFPQAELNRRVWMAGFADPAKGQLAFAFFDQGVGIPTTIKEKRAIRFSKLFQPFGR